MADVYLYISQKKNSNIAIFQKKKDFFFFLLSQHQSIKLCVGVVVVEAFFVEVVLAVFVEVGLVVGVVVGVSWLCPIAYFCDVWPLLLLEPLPQRQQRPLRHLLHLLPQLRGYLHKDQSRWLHVLSK